MAYDASREDRFTREPDAPARGSDGRRGMAVHERNTGWYWLFVLPFVFTLLPFIYNSKSPEFIGMPFFYWYQTLWIVLTAVITYIVYTRTKGS